MLNQIDFLTSIVNFLPNIIRLVFYILILVFAIYILKESTHRYAITLIISSILPITKDVLYIVIQYPFLAYRLEVELGLPLAQALIIMGIWSMLFMILEITGVILLLVSVYMVYKTHIKEG